MAPKKKFAKKNKAAPARIHGTNSLFLTLVFTAVLIVWLAFFIPDYVARIKTVSTTAKNAAGLNDDQRREQVYGDFYKLMQQCSGQIPENATAFLVTNRLADYYYGAYYLYPRRILIGPADKPVDGLNLQNMSVNLTKEFCRKNNISYIIVPRESRVIKVN
jgi:hypothetical protein